MTIENEELQPEQAPDRRAVIEAAFEASEEENTPSSTEEKTPVEPAPKEETVPAATPEESHQDAGSPTPQPYPVDAAPQSWRAPQKAKWAKLDSDVRQEIVRRERETTKVLGESHQARQFTQQFNQALQPFSARLSTLGVPALTVVEQLLKSDHILSSAPKAQRAAFVAKLIKDYDVDILELDSALAGAQPANPVESQVEQLVQQRLAPFQQYMAQQDQQRQQIEQRAAQQIGMTIEKMASDPKYPHFETLRDDMADLIDIASKRGVYLTLEDAYSRATAMNPDVSRQVAAQQALANKQSAAQAANAKAQQALKASVSVGGAPAGAPSGPQGAGRRAAIEAAFEQLEGR